MIFVILGTQDKQFTRLLDDIEKYVKKGLIKEKIIVQAGHTKYISKNMEIFDFVNPSDMQKYIKESKYIIAHGGVGSILDSLKYNKKVIAVARLSKFKEHTNDHQLQIIDEFSKLGYIIDGSNDLEKAIKELDKFKTKKYKSNNENFVKLISDYINNN